MTPKDITTQNLPNGSMDASWKVLIVNWLFHQGVSTILLFGVCLGVWKFLPPEIENQRKANLAAQAEFKSINETLRKEYRDDLKKYMETHKEALEALTDTIRELNLQLSKQTSIVVPPFPTS